MRGKRKRVAAVAFYEDVVVDKKREERRQDKADPFRVTRRHNRVTR